VAIVRYLLKLAEEILNQVPGLIELPVREALCFSVAFGWDHSAFTVSFEPVNDPSIRIEGFVGNQGICSDLSQQNLGALQIMSSRLSWGKAGGIAQCINGDMNLRTQSTLAAPDALILPFLGASVLR